MYKNGSKSVDRLYFLGIAGQTMSGLAVAAKRLGYAVGGADAGAYPPATDALVEAGIHFYTSYEANQVPVDATIVLGNAIPLDNVELAEARRRKQPVVSYPELVEKLTAKQQRIVVTGTHGKTTTSTLIAWLLEKAGQKPDFILGMKSRNFGQSARLVGGATVVIEGDEYASSALDRRSKFDFYHPNHLVVTSLEWDHPDLFPSLAAIEERFVGLIGGLPEGARIVACHDEDGVKRLMKQVDVTPVWYGLAEGCEWQAKEIEYGPQETSFYVYHQGERLWQVTTPLAGEHNVKNILAALAVLEPFDLSVSAISQGLGTFVGAARRFELAGEVADIRVIDDYAHHPTEVAATLAAARARYPHGKLWAVYVPHTYSRTLALLNEYATAFRAADIVLLGELEAAREADMDATVSSADVAAMVGRVNRQVHYVADLEQAAEMLVDNLEPGDTVVCMSVSGGRHFAGRLVEKLGGRWD